jgi:hypothetical protein
MSTVKVDPKRAWCNNSQMVRALPTCYKRLPAAQTANIFMRSRAPPSERHAAVEKLVLAVQFGYSLPSADVPARMAYVLR